MTKIKVTKKGRKTNVPVHIEHTEPAPLSESITLEEIAEILSVLSNQERRNVFRAARHLAKYNKLLAKEV